VDGRVILGADDSARRFHSVGAVGSNRHSSVAARGGGGADGGVV